MRQFDDVSRYLLENPQAEKRRSVSGAVWADWDQRGRLVFAKGGRLFAADPAAYPDIDPVQLADFNDDKPAQIAPPEWAKVW